MHHHFGSLTIIWKEKLTLFARALLRMSYRRNWLSRQGKMLKWQYKGGHLRKEIWGNVGRYRFVLSYTTKLINPSYSCLAVHVCAVPWLIPCGGGSIALKEEQRTHYGYPPNSPKASQSFPAVPLKWSIGLKISIMDRKLRTSLIFFS